MNKDELLQKYLDGELNPEEESKALHLFADDPYMRDMLRFEQKFQSAFRTDNSAELFTVPAGFSDRVMNSIRVNEEAIGHAKSRNIGQWISEKLKWLWQPRPLELRPAYAVIGVVLLIVAVFLPYTSQGPAETGPETLTETVQTASDGVDTNTDKVWLRFVFIDNDAETVEVAGDFSNWEPIALTKQNIDGRQVWTGLVSLERGEHKYMFVKDGEEWVTDPLAPVQQDDGFGNKNAVIHL